MEYKKYIAFYVLISIFSCNSEKTETVKKNNSQNEIEQRAISVSEQVNVSQDTTDEIYDEIKDVFSGSWKDDYVEIDGDREVSWGIVPYANQSYFIIDFQNENKTIIKGASEGGKEGFDRFIAEVLSIKKDGDGLYRFTYCDKIDFLNPKRKHDIVLKHNLMNDTLAIVEYYGQVIENPSEMIRISEPITP